MANETEYDRWWPLLSNPRALIIQAEWAGSAGKLVASGGNFTTVVPHGCSCEAMSDVKGMPEWTVWSKPLAARGTSVAALVINTRQDKPAVVTVALAALGVHPSPVHPPKETDVWSGKVSPVQGTEWHVELPPGGHRWVTFDSATAAGLKSDDASTSWRPQPPTDDPPQPRSPPWHDGLLPPPAEIDPRLISILPHEVPSNSTNASSDDGLAEGATPNVYVFGESSYTMGVAVQQRTGLLFAAEYNSFNIHSFNASGALALPQRKLVSPKSEFFGYGGIFSILAPADGSLYLAYDGNGCMPNNPASVGATCAFVRHIELGPDGAEKITARNLTSPKQMALDAQDRLHIVEEWEEQVVRWDPRTGEQTVVLHNSEYAASGPIEGIAISAAGDIYFSEYGTSHPTH